MTKISQLTSIGDSLAIDDQFLIRDVSDGTTPNKSVTVSGIARALADGSATAPALAFAADKNTGLYRVGADQLSFSTNGTERLRIDSNGQIEAVSLGSAASPDFSYVGDPNTGTFSPGADTWAVSTNGSERARIDSSGRLLVGTFAARNLGGFAPSIFEGTTASDGRLVVFSNRSDSGITTTGAVLHLGRSRSGTVGGNTIVQDGDSVGAVVFNASDGTDAVSVAGRIECFIDGTPGIDDVPGRLVFSTTADGASIPTERLRITSTGQVRLAGAGITFNGDTATANELDDYEEGTFTPALAFSTSNGDLSYTRQSGFYTKIGRQVTVTIHIAFSETTASGTVTLTGLPFTSLNTSFNRASFSVFGSSLTGVTDGLAAALLQNSTTLELYAQNAGNAAALTNTSTGASNLLTIAGSYFV